MIGYVYFIQGMTTTLVKIGYTYGSPLVRMRGMQCESPDILKLVGVIRSEEPEVVEAKLHVWLREYNRHGEWFDSCVLIPLERYIVEYLNA